MSRSLDHGAGGDQDPNPAPETTLAERARTLLALGRAGVLSTQSKKWAGFPFGSLMPFALDAAGRPLFLISAMAMHTHNLEQDPRASLFVAQADSEKDPLGAGRLTLIGEAKKIPAADLGDARERYLTRHENARYYVDFKDFSFYRLELADVYYIGGFGVMGWVEAADFKSAAPDPLAEAAPGILEHMNADHADALAFLAGAIKRIKGSAAKMTAVDRLGFQVRLKTPERMRSVRIGFPREVRSGEECRKAFIDLLGEARAAEARR